MLQAVSIFCLLPGGEREQEFNRICSDQKEKEKKIPTHHNQNVSLRVTLAIFLISLQHN